MLSQIFIVIPILLGISVIIPFGHSYSLSSDDYTGNDKYLKVIKIYAPYEGTTKTSKPTFEMIINGRYRCQNLQTVGERLVENKDFCDMNIDVKNDREYNVTRRFCVHRAILSARSPRLEKYVKEALRLPYVSGKPLIDWPTMPPRIVEYLISYIYSDRIHNFNEKDTIGLLVASYFADLPELITMIEDYMQTKFNTTTHLPELVYWLGWTHRRGFNRLKELLISIARKILQMTPEMFDRFVDDISISAQNQTSSTSLRPRSETTFTIDEHYGRERSRGRDGERSRATDISRDKDRDDDRNRGRDSDRGKDRDRERIRESDRDRENDREIDRRERTLDSEYRSFKEVKERRSNENKTSHEGLIPAPLAIPLKAPYDNDNK